MPGSSVTASDLPNIILVVFDTARRDRFGCYGYPRQTTPTVDALAQDGLLLDTMIANGPWTVPSHGSLFTGLYPSQHGAQWQTGPAMRDSVKVTLAEFLSELGYDTWCVTNNGLISQRSGLARGFVHHAFRLDVERGRRRIVRQVTKLLLGGDSGGAIMNDWLRGQLSSARRPTFLFVNYLECHWCYAPPARFVRQVGGETHGLLEGLVYRATTAARVGPWEAIARADERQLNILSTLYDAELANADNHLRELLGMLEQAGHLARPTLVIVTSDHGEHIGEHGLADHHAALDDLLIRVPFVVWGPGVVPKTRRADVFEFVDLLPSLARLLDRPLPADYLEPRREHLFQGTDLGGDDVAFAEWRSWPDRERARLARRNPSYDFTGLARDLVCARSRQFKLVAGADGSEALYDLVADPLETADVSASHPGPLADLRARLEHARAEWAGWESGPQVYTAEEQRDLEKRLAELGYI
jgi:arylsulfatase A-like enzyme